MIPYDLLSTVAAAVGPHRLEAHGNNRQSPNILDKVQTNSTKSKLKRTKQSQQILNKAPKTMQNPQVLDKSPTYETQVATNIDNR